MYKNLIFIISLMCSPVIIAAGPSINEINSCLALVDFVDIKLDESSDQYDAGDMVLIHKGLSAYSEFLQHDIITPKLLSMYGGNADRAKLMQRLFERQRKSFFRHLDERYTQKKLLTDYASAILDCSGKTRLSVAVAETLKAALDNMKTLAMQK
jgi:hypothetical protein